VEQLNPADPWFSLPAKQITEESRTLTAKRRAAKQRARFRFAQGAKNDNAEKSEKGN